MVGQHGTGMIHLACRAARGEQIKDAEYRFGGTLAKIRAWRIGIEKHGDSFTLLVSIDGEPLQQFRPPVPLHFDAPFYAGFGFCAHLPATVDSAVIADVVLENAEGKSR